MRVLLFDMMQTLVAEPFYDAIQVVLSKAGVSFDECKAYRDPESFLSFERGEIGEPEHYRTFYLESTPPEMRDRLPHPRKLKKEMMSRVKLLPGIADMLDELAKKSQSQEITLGIASNYSIWYQDIFEQIAGLEDRFDFLFFSCELGHRKPAAGYYEIIQQVLQNEFAGLNPDHIFFVDDRSENLVEPDRLGWRTYLMQSPAELRQACQDFLKE